MSVSPRSQAVRPRVAFGPVLSGWGSWEWVGYDTCRALETYFETCTFGGEDTPDADIVVIIKQLPSWRLLQDWAARAAIVYCPIDYFGSAGEIDRAAASLRSCSRIVVHAEVLRKYFTPYARVEYLDHHVKFVRPELAPFSPDGYLMWVGVRSNLPPLETWLQQHRLPRELLILTNFEQPDGPPPLFQPSANQVRIEHWTPESHVRFLKGAAAALDIKGSDFRARHKPPAKALDFLASGIPFAMPAETSSWQHLNRLGFELATPDDLDRWLSRAYWEDTRRFGSALREWLSLERVARRWKWLLNDVWEETGSRLTIQPVASL